MREEQTRGNRSLLDSCIRTDFKLIDNDLGISCVLLLGAFALGLSWFLIVAIIPAIFVIVFLMYRLYGRLYAKSIFGEEAVFYRSLPVPAEVLVLSKIYVGGAVTIILALVGLAGSLIMSLLGGSLTADVMNMYTSYVQRFMDAGAPAVQLPVLAALTFFHGVLLCFTEAAVLLLLVVSYKSLPKRNQSYLIHHCFTAIGVFSLIALVLLPVVLHSLIWEDTNLWLPLLQLVCSTAVLVGAYKRSVKAIERKCEV